MTLRESSLICEHAIESRRSGKNYHHHQGSGEKQFFLMRSSSLSELLLLAQNRVSAQSTCYLSDELYDSFLPRCVEQFCVFTLIILALSLPRMIPCASRHDRQRIAHPDRAFPKSNYCVSKFLSNLVSDSRLGGDLSGTANFAPEVHADQSFA